MSPFVRASLTESQSAMNAPVMDAVLVPPSACITSQSIQNVRSPRYAKSSTARSERPMSRCISCVRPPTLPTVDSRLILCPELRGSIPYSAVSQPLPLPFRKGGTDSSRVAVQSTFVSPTSISTEPSACFMYFLVILTGLISPGFLPSNRIKTFHVALKVFWRHLFSKKGGRFLELKLYAFYPVFQLC